MSKLNKFLPKVRERGRIVRNPVEAVAVGSHRIDCPEDWLRAADAARVGQTHGNRYGRPRMRDDH